MYQYYKTLDSKIEKINEFQPGCWINIVSPTKDELDFINKTHGIDYGFLNESHVQPTEIDL